MTRVDPLVVRSVASYSGSDDAKVASAIAALPAAGGAILFDARTYILTSKLVLPDKPVSLIGYGDGITELRWDCADGGILYEPTSIDGRELVIQGLRLSTTQDGGGTALDATWPENEGAYGQGLTMLDCAIRGSGGSYAWDYGVVTFGVRNAHISRTRFLGKYGDTPETATMVNALVFDSAASSCGIYLNEIHCQLMRTAVAVTETAATGPEGFRLIAGNFVSVYDGIYCNTGEPLFYVGGGTHIKAWHRCIQSSGIRGSISGCHFALQDADVSGHGAIYLTGNCQDMKVHHNSIIGSANYGSDNGVIIMTGATRCNVDHNDFHNFQTGVLFNSGASGNRCFGNLYDGCSNGAVDNDGGNFIVDDYIGACDGGELTISGGVVTATSSLHMLDTEGDAASDDLDTVNGIQVGQIYVFRIANSGRDVVLKDGTGNLRLAGDCTLGSTHDRITLICTGSYLHELSRSINA